MHPALFEPATLVVGQPRRSRWRRYVGPALAVSTVEGTLLAVVTQLTPSQYALREPSGPLVVRIRKRSRFGEFWAARFHFTDAGGRDVGTAGARGLVKTAQLTLHTAQGRRLFLTRRSLLPGLWELTETDPEPNERPEPVGRVTARSADPWLGLQEYVVEMDARLEPAERRTLIASVVCLHLLRRPPGSSAATA
ncbi:hypothetical protein [Streptomyces sp. NPDC096132]|uniref:hypothetical protein n=1 Tax=Streptomyces sp. NPDC096132 TaxID=3366075 RepID=UPI00380DAD0A